VGFVDLHSHVLPGIDDGSPDLETSLMMLRGLVSLGFERVCATPHQKHRLRPDAAAIAVARETTAAALLAGKIELQLSLGAENMWDDVFYERMRDDTIPAYDGGPAFLVEFPVDQLAPALEQRLFDFRMRDRLPVIAHPERYRPLWSDRDRLERIAAEAALVVDLGAVAGYHGRKEARAARRMIKDGLAHAAASDAHTPNDIRVAAEGIAWIRKKVGDQAVKRLLDDNPRRILAGELPT
jgi:protein-tyrosine phosphatase